MNIFKPVLIILASIFSLTHSAFSQIDDSLYYTNPAYYVAKEILNKKIVLLGDNGHHQPGPMKRVYDVIDNWLSICNESSSPHNLTLVLECDSWAADGLNNFISTGDIRLLIDRVSPDFFLEDLEFFVQLKKFTGKIDTINLSRDNKISFTIKGFEDVGYHYEKVRTLNQRQHELWFINERDSTTAYGIINYMQSNPEEKILLFYGTAHLQDGYVNKNLGFQDLSPDESMGYFLPHYLKNRFGDSEVISFVTTVYFDGMIKNKFIAPTKDADIIIKPLNMGDSNTIFTKSDYVYITHFNYIPNISSCYICSRYMLEKTINKINEAKKYMPGYVPNGQYYRNLFNIFYLTGKRFENDSILNIWPELHGFQPIEWLYSQGYDTIINYQGDLISRRNNLYMMLGVDINTGKLNYRLMEWIKKNTDILEQIRFTNSIGIYWVGYPDEKVKAKEYLVKFSGEDFTEPEKYLQWYRMKYYGYEY